MCIRIAIVCIWSFHMSKLKPIVKLLLKDLKALMLKMISYIKIQYFHLVISFNFVNCKMMRKHFDENGNLLFPILISFCLSTWKVITSKHTYCHKGFALGTNITFLLYFVLDFLSFILVCLAHLQHRNDFLTNI